MDQLTERHRRSATNTRIASGNLERGTGTSGTQQNFCRSNGRNVVMNRTSVRAEFGSKPPRRTIVIRNADLIPLPTDISKHPAGVATNGSPALSPDRWSSNRQGRSNLVVESSGRTSGRCSVHRINLCTLKCYRSQSGLSLRDGFVDVSRTTSNSTNPPGQRVARQRDHCAIGETEHGSVTSR